MDDQNFDEYVKRTLEAYVDTSPVDEGVLAEVLTMADHVSPNPNWWSQWFSGGGWLSGSLSLVVLGGMCWWIMGTSSEVPIEVSEATVAHTENNWPEPRQQEEELPVRIVQRVSEEEGRTSERTRAIATPPALANDVPEITPPKQLAVPLPRSYLMVFPLDPESKPEISLAAPIETPPVQRIVLQSSRNFPPTYLRPGVGGNGRSAYKRR